MKSMSRRRVEIRPWAWLLTELVFVTILAVGATVPEGQCPRSLDCARLGRHFCQEGSSTCGPCLPPLQEDKRGKCVVVRRTQHHHTHTQHHANKANSNNFPELDEEIDFLSSVISKQQDSDSAASSSQVDSKAKADHNLAAEAFPSPHQSQAQVPTTTEPPPAPALEPRVGSSRADSSASGGGVTTALPNSTATNDTTSAWHLPNSTNDHTFLILTTVCLLVGASVLVLATTFWIRLRRGMRLAQKVDYPAFGVLPPQPPDNTSSGDNKLAHSAQMYHYQHQKQQMLSLKHRDEAKMPESGATSDEENEDGDFTVYECPGLAPTGEMEVKNPLFDDSTLHLNLQRCDAPPYVNGHRHGDAPPYANGHGGDAPPYVNGHRHSDAPPYVNGCHSHR
ncbi:neural proliferation differentiation and control protein 1 [Engraulis encrasicolus]|uniref:neural proliferation differentiation and control protein 1 n=1 Tax=Engraulis encrasicolus TaxID=184585 RepID=UPI002FD65EF1